MSGRADASPLHMTMRSLLRSLALSACGSVQKSTPCTFSYGDWTPAICPPRGTQQRAASEGSPPGCSRRGSCPGRGSRHANSFADTGDSARAARNSSGYGSACTPTR